VADLVLVGQAFPVIFPNQQREEAQMRLNHRAIIAALIGAAGVMITEAQTATRDPVMLSPQYYTVKSENDRVRVLEYRLKPGEKEVMHSHPSYVVYFFGPATLRATGPDGKTSDTSVTQGEVVLRDPLSHAVENVGTTELHALLIELKPEAR
jgi:quercetin dioxygenase-like cupin family protein